jgi:hypothetical protein
MKSKPMARFDRLLHTMATKPETSEKSAKDNQTSAKASDAAYGDTRTRDANSALVCKCSLRFGLSAICWTRRSPLSLLSQPRPRRIVGGNSE